MADETTLSDVDDTTLKYLIGRLARFRRRALNNGVGLFLLYAIALTAFVIEAQYAYRQSLEDRGVTQRFFDVESQPASEISHASAFALVASAFKAIRTAKNSGVQDLQKCGASVPDCRFADRLWARTQDLINRADLLATEGSLPECKDLIGSGVTERCLLVDNAKARQAIAYTALSGPEAGEDDKCGKEKSENARTLTFLVAPPYCSWDGLAESLAILPQQSADGLLPLKAKDHITWADVRAYRLLRARQDGELFSFVAREIGKELPLRTDDPYPVPGEEIHPEVVAAYFLTIDSFLQYWNRLGHVYPANFDSSRLWAARPYFRAIFGDTPEGRLAKQDWNATLPYLDVAGDGIVWTSCRAITASRPDWFTVRMDADKEMTPTAPRYVIGAACVDYTVSTLGIKALVDTINNDALSDSALLSVEHKSDGSWKAEFAGGNKLLASSLTGAYLNDALARAPQASGAGRDLFPVKLVSFWRSAFGYLIPAKAIDEQSYYAVLVQVRGIGPTGSRPWTMVATLLSLFVMMLALVGGTYSSTQIAKRESDLARLRSLQIGVIETDREDRVIAANDQAEDVIGRRLPIIGDSVARHNRELLTFWDLFDENTILQECPGTTGIRTEYAHIRRKTLERDRSAGDTYAYYVKLINPRELTLNVEGKRGPVQADQSWVKLNAGPIIIPSGGFRRRHSSDLIGTFGTLQHVRVKFGEKLDRELAMARHASSTNREREEASDDSKRGSTIDRNPEGKEPI